jgi:hypothetical protein
MPWIFGAPRFPDKDGVMFLRRLRDVKSNVSLVLIQKSMISGWSTKLSALSGQIRMWLL